MSQLINFVVFLLLAPFFFSIWVAGLHFLATIPDPSRLLWFALGLLVPLIVGAAMVGPRSRFIGAASHELTHSLVGSVFALTTTGIAASSKESGVSGVTAFATPSNTLVRLAPYYFPLFTVPFLLLKPFVAGRGPFANMVVDLLIGASLGFHYDLHLKQVHFGQTDISRTGYIAAFGIIYTFMLVFLVLIVAIVLGNYHHLGEFAAESVVRAPDYYRAAIDWLSMALHP